MIGFGAGEPDFPTPAYIVEAAVEACRDPRNHRYTPAGGLPELKAAIVAKTARDSGYAVEPAQVLVTNGGKQAIYEAFATILDPGDEVLLPAPYWTTYPEAIRLAGGVPVEVLADETQGYKVTVDQLEAARDRPHEGDAVLLAVEPHRRRRHARARSRRSAAGCSSHGLWVVTDEIYEHLTYGDAETTSLPVVVPELADRCIVVNGVAKTYAMTGWRVGWLLGPKDVVKAATNLQSHQTSNVNNVAQRAAIAALDGRPDRGRRDAGGLRPAPHARWSGCSTRSPGSSAPSRPARSTPTPRSRACSAGRSRPAPPTTSAELAEIILDEAEVAVVPGEAFGAPGYLRLSYALGDDDLVEGVGRMQKLLG